ncbi:unnamed protein product [Mesocestoides corti]|uniref:Uncharacterized protein n=1 Tax=Mesocestoides corti TaxID=53468 RepID=A0A0R3UBM8_MESCO|nr:unnamed protein product [Mesocestoides corti]
MVETEEKKTKKKKKKKEQKGRCDNEAEADTCRVQWTRIIMNAILMRKSVHGYHPAARVVKAIPNPFATLSFVGI